MIVAGFLAAGIQFIPVDRTNPPVEEDVAAPAAVKSILRQSCYDCHSNETSWPWYGHVAPVSWLVASDVHEAREELNFSTWNRLRPDQRVRLIREAWEEVEGGKMPLSIYLLAHPGARLSAEHRDALRAWAGPEGAPANGDAPNRDQAGLGR